MAMPVFKEGAMSPTVASFIIPGTGGDGSRGWFDCGDGVAVTWTEFVALCDAVTPGFHPDTFAELKEKVAALDGELKAAKAELRKRDDESADAEKYRALRELMAPELVPA
jgi:hypothetical protein